MNEALATLKHYFEGFILIGTGKKGKAVSIRYLSGGAQVELENYIAVLKDQVNAIEEMIDDIAGDLPEPDTEGENLA